MGSISIQRGSSLPQTVSVESTINSTTTLLSAKGSFTGVFEDTLNYTQVGISVFADVDSSTVSQTAVDQNIHNAFCIQYSSDGITIDSSQAFFVEGGKGKIYSFSPTYRFFRVLYLNGSQPQQEFRLKTILKSTASTPLQAAQDVTLQKVVDSMSGVTHGSLKELRIQDSYARELLEHVLSRLSIMNIHLAKLSGLDLSMDDFDLNIHEEI